MRRMLALVAAATAACGGTGGGPEPGGDVDDVAAGAIVVTSSAFGQSDTIPVGFTCDGENVSPPLEWSGVPDDVTELTLLLEDPDAPGGTFVHWSVRGIDPGSTGVEEDTVPEAGEELQNDFGATAYGGPCPPEGEDPHRYVFTVGAVAADGRAVAAGSLTGLYGRP